MVGTYVSNGDQEAHATPRGPQSAGNAGGPPGSRWDGPTGEVFEGFGDKIEEVVITFGVDEGVCGSGRCIFTRSSYSQVLRAWLERKARNSRENGHKWDGMLMEEALSYLYYPLMYLCFDTNGSRKKERGLIECQR